MQNNIQVLNNMLLLTVKEEIENLGDESIYIPSLTITFDIQIETTDTKTKSVKTRIEKIEPPNIENKILVEYITKELESKLKENTEQNHVTWQVLKVALVIPMLGKVFTRDFSSLKTLLVLGDVDRVASRLVPAQADRATLRK